MLGLAHLEGGHGMIIKRQKGSDTIIFKAGPRRKTSFLFQLSDLSAFGNPIKKPMKIRGNYRKCMKIFLENELNELVINLKDGEFFEIESPIFSRGRSKKDIEEYCRMYRSGEIKTEPTKLEIPITLPRGNAIKIYSLKDSFVHYIVNDGGKFVETGDYKYVEKISGVYF